VAKHAQKPPTERESPGGGDPGNHPNKGIAQDRPRQPSPAPDRMPQAAPPVEVDDTGATVCYANFCRVTATPEELTIDLGFHHEAFRGQSQRVAIGQRVVVNYYTAKRMLQALSLAVARHEAAFGVLQTDARKRMKPTARGAGAPPMGQTPPSGAQPPTGPPLQKAG